MSPSLVLMLLIAFAYASAADTSTKLVCGKDSIQIDISESFLSELKIEVSDSKQLHFNEFPECYAEPAAQGGYSITLFPPYKNCGTKVQPEADVYSYFNEIVYKTDATKIRIYKFRCDYDKKYVVSSDLALTPVIRTLNFRTERGKFSVGMGLYQRSDFNPKSMFSLRPTVLVGTTVYVSVDMLDNFGTKDIVTSIETCYATDNKNHATHNLYHGLIVNKCSSPDDDTVQIISNGEDLSARFQFAMFQWRNGVEYFYLHCEIKVCNKTEEECSGVGPVCNGITEVESVLRRRREVVESKDGPDDFVQGNKGIVSYGPIALKEKEDEEEVGEGTFEEVYEELEKDQRFLRVYIYACLAAVVLVVGIVVIIVTIVRKTRVGTVKRLDDRTASTESI